MAATMLRFSVETVIFHLMVNSTRLKTVRSDFWRGPNTTVALRLLENVVKVPNLEVWKSCFRHLPITAVCEDLAPGKAKSDHVSNRKYIGSRDCFSLSWCKIFAKPLYSSFFFFSQPSALTRAVLKTKHPQIAVKFFDDVPFELSF